MTNIAKILENAPLGIKLYSPICGECKLEEVMHDFISVSDVNHKEWDFNSDGAFDANGECLLWPSKERLNWAGWQTVLMRQEECLGTVVMSGIGSEYIITHDGFVLCENINKCLDFLCAPSIDMRFADIEESEKAMKMLEEENGYKWDEDAEELRKIEKSEFDVGDWICHDKMHDIRQITDVDRLTDTYWSVSVKDGQKLSNTIQYMDKSYHIWGLNDIMNGDILVSEYGTIFMTNGKIESLYTGESGPDFICSLAYNGDFNTIYEPFFEREKPCPFTTSPRPATYEECQKLFKAIDDNHCIVHFNMDNEITSFQVLDEEPLEAVPTMPEDKLEGALENSPNSSEEKFKEDLKELLMKHNMDQLMSVPADIIVEYMTNNLKNAHTLITKERKAFYEQHKAIN